MPNMRGLAAAKGEWDLVFLALNLGRIRSLVAFLTPQASFYWLVEGLWPFKAL